ncbi:MAG TPA: LLM class flavin-dependent oxidoreductase [Mycobacteriales bacterium]|jgi:alkanesulfonate monooxygenase SsuD/methylene tetrahydromethanopterin reductase-like flavin-dependent oxidoreductase (luciferase family)|nr:LLM class flavin-dependent oxidoreductase [Mycobacteriales bacterium]
MWFGYQLRPHLSVQAQAQSAEKASLNGVVVPEHHGLTQWASNPILMAYAAGVATSTIDVGAAPLLLPLYQPQRLAEEAAFINNELGGRLIVGVGAGYMPEDFEHFGLDVANRGALTDEGIDILRLAWQGQPFEFNGAQQSFRAQVCLPVPEVIPPIWVAAGSRAGARRAAKRGDAILLDDLRPLDELVDLADEYRTVCEANDKPASVVLMRRVWIGDPDYARRQLRDEVDAYRSTVVKRSDAPWLGAAASQPEAQSDGPPILCGTVAEIAEQLAECVGAVGADKVVFKAPFIVGTPSLDVILDQIHAVGEQLVAPSRGGLDDAQGVGR